MKMKRAAIRSLAAFLTVALGLACGAQAGSAWDFTPINWTGATNNVWSNTGNWSGGAVPITRFNAPSFINGGNGNTTIDLGTGATAEYIIFDTANAAAYTIGSGGVGVQNLTFYSAGRARIVMGAAVANDELFNANVILGTGNTVSVVQDSVNTLTFAGGIMAGASGANTLAQLPQLAT
ncbi:MAG: hypothetical protein ABFD92_00310 [Planctomycetaceae bacterium]|nr:hypothetical protein [Planctomycetaceae bacterium]